MARTDEWATKVVALLKAGNPDAAAAQIQVAPGVKNLLALQAAMAAGRYTGRWRNVDAAVQDAIAALSAPRLHRSP